MSQCPKPKLSYKHEVIQGKHRIVIHDSDGEFLFHSMENSFELAHASVEPILHSLIEKSIESGAKESLRQKFKPSTRKMDGLYPIHPSDWKRITEYDFTNGMIGIITQAELGRIRGVSRQAIHQSVSRGDVEIFVWRDEKYIPFDTIAVNPMFFEKIGPPMVIHYAESGKRKKPRRRFKKDSV